MKLKLLHARASSFAVDSRSRSRVARLAAPLIRVVPHRDRRRARAAALGYGDTVVLVGSCFAETMREKMLERRLDARGGAHGVVCFGRARLAADSRKAPGGAPYAPSELLRGRSSR